MHIFASCGSDGMEVSALPHDLMKDLQLRYYAPAPVLLYIYM